MRYPTYTPLDTLSLQIWWRYHWSFGGNHVASRPKEQHHSDHIQEQRFQKFNDCLFESVWRTSSWVEAWTISLHLFVAKALWGAHYLVWDLLREMILSIINHSTKLRTERRLHCHSTVGRDRYSVDRIGSIWGEKESLRDEILRDLRGWESLVYDSDMMCPVHWKQQKSLLKFLQYFSHFLCIH